MLFVPVLSEANYQRRNSQSNWVLYQRQRRRLYVADWK